MGRWSWLRARRRARLGDRVEVVSVAPLFAEAIRRIHRRESISSLFTVPPFGAGG